MPTWHTSLPGPHPYKVETNDVESLVDFRRRCNIVRVGSGEGRMGPGGVIVLHPYSQTSTLQL